MSIRMMIVDDHEIVRAGLRELVANTEIEVVAEASSGDQVHEMLNMIAVDVVLLDVRMFPGDGLTSLGRIKLDRPALPVLLLSTFDNPTYIAVSYTHLTLTTILLV